MNNIQLYMQQQCQWHFLLLAISWKKKHIVGVIIVFILISEELPSWKMTLELFIVI